VRVARWVPLGQKHKEISPVGLMPQARWPVVTTSASGVTSELWDAFKARADELNMTDREAMEEAIRDVVAAARAGEAVDWPHPTGPLTRPIRIHEEVLNEARALRKELGYKLNVVMLAAMKRWIKKER
jgi:hypothetical protein